MIHPFARDLRLHAYRCASIDPAWHMHMGIGHRPRHYTTMSDAEIAALPLADLAHPSGCNFFLWTISPLNERFWTRVWPAWKAQGLRYSGRAFVWIKLTPNGDRLHIGQGQTTRKNAEDVLLFKTGRPKRLVRNIHEVIVAPRGKHSVKPDEFYKRVEQYCDGPRADVFSRRRRPGWDAYGWGLESE